LQQSENGAGARQVHQPSAVVDCGYPCRVDSATNAIVVTGPPSSIVSVAVYPFSLSDLQEIGGRIDSAALPHPDWGYRLVGDATDHETVRATLRAVGVNPIFVAAVADRSIIPGI